MSLPLSLCALLIDGIRHLLKKGFAINRCSPSLQTEKREFSSAGSEHLPYKKVATFCYYVVTSRVLVHIKYKVPHSVP